jgi:hypothetical protein
MFMGRVGLPLEYCEDCFGVDTSGVQKWPSSYLHRLQQGSS